MQIAKRAVKIFKIKNRCGYAAIYAGHLTEGGTPHQACARMLKAVRRTSKKKK
jgi:hypothetical protein